MSPLFKKRPPVTVHKFFCRKVLRHFYVPFVDPTDARHGSAPDQRPAKGGSAASRC
jgi:hypothetical protein